MKYDTHAESSLGHVHPKGHRWKVSSKKQAISLSSFDFKSPQVGMYLCWSLYFEASKTYSLLTVGMGSTTSNQGNTTVVHTPISCINWEKDFEIHLVFDTDSVPKLLMWSAVPRFPFWSPFPLFICWLWMKWWQELSNKTDWTTCPKQLPHIQMSCNGLITMCNTRHSNCWRKNALMPQPCIMQRDEEVQSRLLARLAFGCKTCL